MASETRRRGNQTAPAPFQRSHRLSTCSFSHENQIASKPNPNASPHAPPPPREKQSKRETHRTGSLGPRSFFFVFFCFVLLFCLPAPHTPGTGAAVRVRGCGRYVSYPGPPHGRQMRIKLLLTANPLAISQLPRAAVGGRGAAFPSRAVGCSPCWIGLEPRRRPREWYGTDGPGSGQSSRCGARSGAAIEGRPGLRGGGRVTGRIHTYAMHRDIS